ncbi:MAG: tyrosine-type recombinase/integrase [Aggregatilineales bacterium]
MSANWERYPLSSQQPTVKVWLTIQQNLGLAPNTIYAYAHALEDFFQFCTREGINPVSATNAHIAAYVHDMTTRPNPHSNGEKIGLSNSTLQQRLTALRLFFDYLVEDGYRAQNPVKRGHYTSGKGYGGQRERGLIPHYHKLPWIPNEEQWQAILAAVRDEPLRNRAMFALAYDAALRREELCSLESILSELNFASKRDLAKKPNCLYQQKAHEHDYLCGCGPPRLTNHPIANHLKPGCLNEIP